MASHAGDNVALPTPPPEVGEVDPSEDVCAICLEGHSDPCFTPCKHRFCRKCIESMLLCGRSSKCPMCRSNLSRYSVRSSLTGLALKEPEVKSALDNTVFVQKWGAVGLSSYHFSPERCFIAYRKDVIPSSWVCDDGSSVPEEKNFECWNYNPTTRTFQGIVEWEPTFFGNKVWTYKLVFDEGFTQIVSGECSMARQDGSSNGVLFFGNRPLGSPAGTSVFYRRARNTIWGSAFIQKHGHVGAASYHFLEDGTGFIDFSEPLDWWYDYMASDFPDRVPLQEISYDEEERVLLCYADLSQSPFGKETKWVYRMEFDEAFGMIIGGQVSCCSPEKVVPRRFVDWNIRVGDDPEVLQYQILAPWDT
mmetsp:Transcript_455/g.627  ORF Transcript_455/g.627 Transcript_455/m.627 type:complete len:363 (+) Transcript_455:750-1838(+)